MSFALAQRRTGRKVGRSCRAATAKLRKRRVCARYVAKGTLTRKLTKPCAQSVAFSGRIGKKALRPGRSRVVLVAAGPGGRSKAVTLRFTVVSR